MYLCWCVWGCGVHIQNAYKEKKMATKKMELLDNLREELSRKRTQQDYLEHGDTHSLSQHTHTHTHIFSHPHTRVRARTHAHTHTHTHHHNHIQHMHATTYPDLTYACTTGILKSLKLWLDPLDHDAKTFKGKVRIQFFRVLEYTYIILQQHE